MKKNIIFIIILVIIAISGAAAFIWAYSQMVYYRDNTETVINQSEEAIRSEQYIADEEAFNERMKQPYLEFSGPADFGSISFSYPKTWSAYNIENNSKTYKTVFYPGVIPPISKDTAVALKVEVINNDYEDELENYEKLITRGELSASPITLKNGQEGIIFNGHQSNDFKSTFVLLKLRDKTILIQTDTDSYIGDFDDVILSSFSYNL